jgi:hypothetical protein
MNEQYLWDRSGEPDPEIERLEQTLAPLRYRHRAPERRKSTVGLRWAAAAAVLIAAVALSQIAMPRLGTTAWRVAGRDVRSGQVLRTGGSGLSLESDAVGRVDLGPQSELRAATDHKLLLDRGELHAFIWGPPREFVVDTPSARTVDLGCEYTLNVDAAGNGIVRVKMGWVAFQFGDHESFIPAGAQCVTSKRHGPGIPFYEDAPDAVRQGVAAFEEGDRAALGRVLQAARPVDGLTLWHLLTRVPRQDVGAVYDRFAALVPLPPEVTREAVERRDRRAIDLAWDALKLENTDWWRGWERRW